MGSSRLPEKDNQPGQEPASPRSNAPWPNPDLSVLDLAGLDRLIQALHDDGYAVKGPVLRDRAIVYDSIAGVRDLPAGWEDEQAPGRYRIENQGHGRLFDHVAGAQNWKRFFYPPDEVLWRAERRDGALEIKQAQDARQEKPLALIGPRDCDLRAMGIQDKVFDSAGFQDPRYRVRRQRAFIVALDCGRAAETCFCTSTGGGPSARSGYDIALTETGSALDDSQLFVARAGSAAGAALLHHLEFPEPPASLLNEAEARVRETAARLSRGLPSGTADILRDNRESPYWEEVAGRCLGCANCTLACPTCFCSTTREVTDLGGEVSDHHRTWESCFTMAFSEVHGGIIRGSLAASYRQWLTHKLADWWDQFGSSGCVGCGRCITWCPVGIDLTAEVRALSDKAAGDSR